MFSPTMKQKIRDKWVAIRASQEISVSFTRFNQTTLVPAQNIVVTTRIRLTEEFGVPVKDSSMRLAIFGAINLDIQIGDRFDYYGQAAVVTNVQPHRLFQTTAYAEVTT